MRFRCVGIILVLLVFWWGYEQAVDNFHERYIYLKEWPEASDATAGLKVSEVRSILDQPFSYLDKGRQFYAFESADGKYVLKFIKCQRFNEFDFPFIKEMRKVRVKEKQQRLKALFQSCQLSLDPLSDLTGVLFTHLVNKPEVEKKVTLIDRVGFQHVINIDEAPFVLQYRAQKVIPTFENEIGKEYERIDQIIHLFVNRAKRFVIDTDGGIFVRDNIGFLGERAVFIDIGTFIKSEQSMTRKQLTEDFEKLQPFALWLEEKNRAFATYFFKEVEKIKNDSN